ncbi:hypothetical protein VQ02_15925 [Methylobacterium variabile]|jgi:hypothetical protein|uniref:Uncharacterized protein n=1 Tax=Methylobacterium variabile TaxID=298794 RepID=A0A0J6SRR4_9HYPH|nr:hypothetical protein [Methylobacterium variabile]KMO36277.1 hypothetical protein VQ02_15925 [Methylobacterium variabile]
MPNLRAALLTAIGIGLIALALAGIAERNTQSRLERALRSAPPIQTVSSAGISCGVTGPGEA